MYMANLITIIRLLSGRKVYDTQIDTDNLLTTDQKASIPTGVNGTNQLVAEDDARLPSSDEAAALEAAPNALSASNPVADVQYVQGLISGVDWQESIEHSVDYVKATAGAPSGTATSGEKCLNTNEAKIYTYTTSWDSGVAVSSGDRAIHKDTGSDTSGDSGTYTASNKIYEYNGTTFDETTANEGMASWIEDEDVVYVFNGTAWVKFGSTVTHNNTSGLQGGTTDQYYHITSNQEAGLDAATAITASNPPQTLSDRDKMPQKISFCYFGGMPASQTDTEFYDEPGVVQRVLTKAAGSIVGIVAQLESNRTAGTMTIEPTVNGTKVTPSDLDLTINAGTPNDATAKVAPATTGLTFSAGDKLGVKVTTDSSWAPTTATIRIDLLVVYDD